MIEKAKQTNLPEDAQAANDLAALCDRFEKKLHDLELTRMISIQTVSYTHLDVYKRQHQKNLILNQLDREVFQKIIQTPLAIIAFVRLLVI